MKKKKKNKEEREKKRKQKIISAQKILGELRGRIEKLLMQSRSSGNGKMSIQKSIALKWKMKTMW